MDPDPMLEVFDPDEVYVFGNLSFVGACERTVVASLEALQQGIVGFPCANLRTAAIRPTDGRLLYLESPARAGVRVFHCDGCRYDSPELPYPRDPTSNDELLAVAGCGPSSVDGFRVGPEGQIVHDCDAQWRDEDGAPLTAGGQALFLGQRDTALGPGFILELDTKEEIPIVGLQWRSEPFVVAARAREDGFWLVVRGPVEGPGQRARWHVAFDGSATNEGDYPSLPINVKEPSFGKLDGAGRLIESASYEATDGLGSAIVRRSLDGDSEILNRSKSAFFGLVTGP